MFQFYFVGRLQCQINMKLVFRISEDGSEIYIITSLVFFSNIQNRDICIYLKICQLLRYFMQIFKTYR